MRPWRLVGRALLLVATGVSLYLLAPTLIDLFSNWQALKDLQPWWLLLGVVFEATSLIALWEARRIALHTPSWFAVGTSQLAAGAAASIVPGGAATAGAFAYRMLVRAGVRPGDVAAGLTATTLGTTVMLFALPVLALPAIVGDAAAPRGLVHTAYIGVGAFLLAVAAGVAALRWDAPLRAVGRAAAWVLRLLPGDRDTEDVPERLLVQRDRMKRTFGARWPLAVCGLAGKPGFDYLALVCCVAAVGERPSPSLLLLAYAAGSLLSLIPFTPGGLGFVEAGLTGMLALAGVGAHEAVVATLAYRLLSFWLPLPAGGVAYLLYRRRYSSITSP